MFKLYALTLAFLYAAFCWQTMPSACFMPSYAVTCQRVQLDQMATWSPLVDWTVVYQIHPRS